MDFERYSTEHRHFISDELPSLLVETARPGRIIDLGCGDGAVLWALARRGILQEGSSGVDVSPQRVAEAERLIPSIRGVVADATATGLPDGVAEGVVCSAVIEHVPDQSALVAEIARLLRPGGWWYVNSVLRSPKAWWFYKVDGRRVLDPTHVREYESESEFRTALAHPDLTTASVRVSPMRFATSDLVLRLAGRLRLLSRQRIASLYQRRSWLRTVRRARIRVPGYFLIEAHGTRR